jgi:hypothetical protein
LRQQINEFSFIFDLSLIEFWLPSDAVSLKTLKHLYKLLKALGANHLVWMGCHKDGQINILAFLI